MGTAARPLSFDDLVKQLADEFNMKQVDTVRAVAVLLKRSMKFRMWTWFYCSYSGKGTIRMKKASGWSPCKPFDHVTSRIIFNDELIEEMVNEAVRFVEEIRK